jgi:hypothetical protein
VSRRKQGNTYLRLYHAVQIKAIDAMTVCQNGKKQIWLDSRQVEAYLASHEKHSVSPSASQDTADAASRIVAAVEDMAIAIRQMAAVVSLLKG